MTAAQFRGWMQRNGWSKNALAEALDISARQIAYYRSGEQRVPRVVALALQTLERESSLSDS